MPENIYNKNFGNYKNGDLQAAIESGEILEAPVIKCDKELNLTVQLGSNAVGILPFEEFEYSIHNKPTKMSAVVSKIGKFIKFKVTGVDTIDGNTVYKLSRKQAQKECYDNYISKLQIGQVVNAKVTYLETYGAFCDIGCGLVALLPADSVCVAKITDTKKNLAGMGKIKAVVKKIENGMITLTHKELLGTWEENVANLNKGDIIPGKVKGIEEYGVFVELTPNLVGLADPYPDAKENDIVNVFIKSIYPEKMKVKLVIVGKGTESSGKIHYNYRLPESGFIRDWVYSPDCCDRKIESHF